jgi:hypothetical protein
LSALLISIAVLGSSSEAAIIANFTDGNGTSSVDQFAGIAGSGWSAGWAVGTTSASQSPTVVNTNPLSGIPGDNYLSVSATGSAATAVARVGRQYTETGSDVDLDAIYTIRFDYRADSALGASDATNSASNRYNILGSTAASTSTASSNTWIAAVYAGTNGADNDKPNGFGSSNVGNWVFLDNPGNTTVGMSSMNFVDSQISLAAGTVYHFEIQVDPVNRKYLPSVSDGTTTYTAPSFLGFRNQSTTASTFLQFHAFMTTASASAAYSVDYIVIVPEPSAVVLVCFAVAGLGCLKCRMSGVRN